MLTAFHHVKGDILPAEQWLLPSIPNKEYPFFRLQKAHFLNAFFSSPGVMKQSLSFRGSIASFTGPPGTHLNVFLKQPNISVVINGGGFSSVSKKDSKQLRKREAIRKVWHRFESCSSSHFFKLFFFWRKRLKWGY